MILGGLLVGFRCKRHLRLMYCTDMTHTEGVPGLVQLVLPWAADNCI